MNPSTIANAIPVSGPLTLTNPGSETVFSLATNNLAVLEIPASLTFPGALIQGEQSVADFFLDARAFLIRVGGTIKTQHGNETVSFRLLQGDGYDIGGQTQRPVWTVNQVAVIGTTCNFLVEARLTWDSVSNKLQGTWYGQVNGSLQDLAVINVANVVTDPDVAPKNATLPFVLATTLGGTVGSGQDSVIKLYQFEAEAL